MKTITKTEVVPAEEVTITTFGCDFCEFVADDEDDVKKHHAKEHACKRTMSVEGVDLYWFDSEEDAKAWLECDEYGADMHSVNWSGAGWYHTSWSTEPCGRGCCSRSRRTLSPVGWYLSELEEDAKQAERRADANRRLAQAIRQEAGDG